MDPEKIRLPDRNEQLDKAKRDKIKALVSAVILGVIAVFSAAVCIDPTIADRVSLDARTIKHFMPVFIVLAVLNVIRFFSDKKTIRKLSEQYEEDRASLDLVEDQEEK